MRYFLALFMYIFLNQIEIEVEFDNFDWKSCSTKTLLLAKQLIQRLHTPLRPIYLMFSKSLRLRKYMMESYLIYLPILYIIQYLLHSFRSVKKKKRNTSHPNPIQVVINFTYTFKNVKVLRDQIMNHNNRKIQLSVPYAFFRL